MTLDEETIWTFVDVWFPYRDEDGRPVPLPFGWYTKVRGLTQLGITGDDWREIVPRAMGATKVETTGVFAYAIGIAWGFLADRNRYTSDAAVAARHSAEAE